jgi:hypothetical protein
VWLRFYMFSLVFVMQKRMPCYILQPETIISEVLTRSKGPLSCSHMYGTTTVPALQTLSVHFTCILVYPVSRQTR